ncbi:MAG: hypothetical protein ACM3NV_07985, partial [Syntrophothermus sp.]
PIAAALWRLTGPGGYDSGVHSAAGTGIAALGGISVPGPGAFTLRVWLRDEAANESVANAVEVSLRFDDQPPAVAFAPGADDSAPAQLEATVADGLSGPASGRLLYRRADARDWTELPTKLLAEAAGGARLLAPLPGLDPGTYLFRADAVDAAGNSASTTLRADGTRMTVRVPLPPPAARTRLFARLTRGGRGAARGPESGAERLAVPFDGAAVLRGRLLRADGGGLAGRELRVVSRPSRGALGDAVAVSIRTGPHGGFELELPPGPSRRVTVSFPGEPGLAAATRPGLLLRVRSGVTLRAVPRTLRTGQAVRLRGRVAGRGAPIPRRGKLVAIQYREAATGRWRPILVTRSDHAGRFRAHYRFRYVSGPTEIRLRATALSEERWPYAPGSSAPLTVRVDDR